MSLTNYTYLIKLITNSATLSKISQVSRILCPAYVRPDSSGLSTVYIDIYTSAQSNISYSLHVSYFQSFVVR